MKPASIFIITALFVALAGCEVDEPSFDEFKIEGLTIENYPRVDGSTSTHPLNLIIAAKLLNLEYEFYKGNGVIIYSEYYFGSTLWDKLLCSQTHEAILNLIDNKVDVITVARKMSQDEKDYARSKGVNLVETPIALDGLDFIVNAGNPVNSLTIKQIQDIYLGKITNWSEVGGADEAILPFIRNANSGSQEMMNEFVMNNVAMPDWEIAYGDELTLSTMLLVYFELQLNPNAICYTPHYYKEYLVNETAHESIKTLKINDIASNETSIKDGTYPVIAPVYAMVQSNINKQSNAYKIYKLLQTTYGKAVIEESGYVPYR
ncbi:MAG: substrate-binding domain-containing protein [Tannerella sp.]|nr:substrate-binding domain-containing protein [Tannerella sp.]